METTIRYAFHWAHCSLAFATQRVQWFFNFYISPRISTSLQTVGVWDDSNKSCISTVSENLSSVWVKQVELRMLKLWSSARLLIGYFLAYLSFLPSIHMFRQKRRKNGSESVPPEARLWWLLYGKPGVSTTGIIDPRFITRYSWYSQSYPVCLLAFLASHGQLWVHQMFIGLRLWYSPW